MSGDQYNKYRFLPKISYNILSNLMDNPESEIIWKLLKDTSRDAWNISNLTKQEKRRLIYDGSENGETNFSVFFDSGMDDSIDHEKAFLKIYPYFCIPENPYTGIVDVAFEIIAHYKVNTLSNYRTRIDSIMAAIIASLNGSDVGGIGLMYFDSSRARMDKFQNFNQPPYKGKILIMSVNV